MQPSARACLWATPAAASPRVCTAQRVLTTSDQTLCAGERESSRGLHASARAVQQGGACCGSARLLLKDALAEDAGRPALIVPRSGVSACTAGGAGLRLTSVAALKLPGPPRLHQEIIRRLKSARQQASPAAAAVRQCRPGHLGVLGAVVVPRRGVAGSSAMVCSTTTDPRHGRRCLSSAQGAQVQQSHCVGHARQPLPCQACKRGSDEQAPKGAHLLAGLPARLCRAVQLLGQGLQDVLLQPGSAPQLSLTWLGHMPIQARAAVLHLAASRSQDRDMCSDGVTALQMESGTD